jgi:hypothetical protein
VSSHTVQFEGVLSPEQQTQATSEYLAAVSGLTGTPVADLSGTVVANPDGSYTFTASTREGVPAVQVSDAAIASINEGLPSTFEAAALPAVTQSIGAAAAPSTACCGAS